MSLVAFVAHLLSAWFAFLLPCFNSYKALKHRPVSEPELERWVMYWSVLGISIAIEYSCEWLVSWFPFYWETKTVFLLFLSLPQTQGSTYIYRMYLEPFLEKNEAEIDTGIQTAKTNLLTFLQGRIQALWELLVTLINKAPPPSSSGQQPTGSQGSNATTDPIALAQNLWRAYGPMVSGMVNQANATPSRATPPPSNLPPSFASASTTSFMAPANPSLRHQIPEANTPLPPTPNINTQAPPPFPIPEFH